MMLEELVIRIFEHEGRIVVHHIYPNSLKKTYRVKGITKQETTLMVVYDLVTLLQRMDVTEINDHKSKVGLSSLLEVIKLIGGLM